MSGTSAPVICMLCSGGVEHAGGIGRWAGYLQESWREQDRRPELEIVDTRGFGGYWVGAVTFMHALLRITALGLSGRLALIHANLSIRGSTLRKFLICPLAAILRVPVVLHLHGSGYDQFFRDLPGWMKPGVVWMFRRASAVVVLGDYWRDFLIREVDVAPAKIVKILNAVPAPRLMPGDKPAGDPCHILMLGRLGARKGVPELLDALASSALRDRAWQATLAGDGEVEAYRQQATDLGLAGRVTMPGWVTAGDAAQLLSMADILVLPSHEENLPVAVLEALSYGIAVVATPVGATPEIVEDGVSASFVPVGDAPALARALAVLIDDPETRRRIGTAGRQVFLDQLGIDQAVHRFGALYQSILTSWPARGRHPASGIAG